MKYTNPIELTSDEALLLQQISESGEDDVIGLASSLSMSRRRVMEVLAHLKHKGLVIVKAAYGDWWVRTSTKGKRMVHHLWPELTMLY